MTAAQWAELIESYVAGRLSADSFKRRFLEAFTAAVTARASVPAGVQELAYVVEAYAGDPMARGHDVTDDHDMRGAAIAALRDLGVAAQPANAGGARGASPDPVIIEGVDPEALRRRAHTTVYTVGAIGAAGCAMALLYVGIGVLQLFAVADQIQRVTDLGPVIATIAGLLLAFIPILGGVIAYFGATDGWGWPNLVAGMVFFAFPITILLVGFFQRHRWLRGGRR